MKGCGVRPEVNIEPEEGLLSFGNIVVGEIYEKSFKIKRLNLNKDKALKNDT